jgi:hypothetical protein
MYGFLPAPRWSDRNRITPAPEVSLDFAMWLQQNFDRLVYEQEDSEEG